MFNKLNAKDILSLNEKLPAGVKVIELKPTYDVGGCTIILAFEIKGDYYNDALVYPGGEPTHSRVVRDTLIALTYFLMEV